MALRVLYRHRIIGLANRALAGASEFVPEFARHELHRRASAIARTNLSLAGESIRLDEAFRTAGIAAGFLKGPVLSLQLFGDVGRRHSRDLDLMVDQGDLVASAHLLKEMGYRSASGVDADAIADWSQRLNQWEFRHGANGTLVELHWRLCPNARLAAPLAASLAWTPVAIAGDRMVSTLTGDALGAYLCLHGSLHAWSRLKWLADIDAWMACDADSPRRLLTYADSVGLGRPAGQALWLAAALLGTPLAPQTRQALKRDRAVRRLGNVALGVMAAGGAATELEDTAFGSARVRLSHFALAPGVRHWRAQFAAALASADDLKHVRLPRRLAFAYPALRPLLWVSRRLTAFAAPHLQRRRSRQIRTEDQRHRP